MPLYIQDTVNFISKLRPRRLWNAAKLLSSFYLTRWLRRPIQWGLPMTVSVEPTTACNLRCPECPSGLRAFSRPTGKLKKESFEKMISEVSDHLIYLTFYFQGEPYLNPDFLDMVKIADRHKIYTSTSTNAHFLDDENSRKTIESGLNRLIISIDGTTQETYESYRKEGDLQKVLEGTANILKWKKQLKSPLKVIWQYLVVKPNEHQINDVKKLAKTYGVDKVVFKTAQLYDYKNGNELMPSIDKYSRYKKNSNGSFSIKNKLEDKCWKMWNSCVITWDGQVIPCCFDKDASHSFGNVNTSSFSEIWFSQPYQNFRNSLLNARSEIEICKNCTEGLKVWS